MQLGDALVEVVVAVASSVGTAGLFIWRAGRYLKGLEDRLAGVENKHRDIDKKVDDHNEEDDKRHRDLKKDFDEANKNSEESWRILNRTLGRIEGALGVEENPTPQMRRRQKSYPGAE